jgi:hypothetical protein
MASSFDECWPYPLQSIDEPDPIAVTDCDLCKASISHFIGLKLLDKIVVDCPLAEVRLVQRIHDIIACNRTYPLNE